MVEVEPMATSTPEAHAGFKEDVKEAPPKGEQALTPTQTNARFRVEPFGPGAARMGALPLLTAPGTAPLRCPACHSERAWG